MILDINIGFIGLGNVGSKLAMSILHGKYNLYIYDLDKYKANHLIKKGAVFSNSIHDLVNSCSIIITCLPSPSAISDVIEGENGVLKYINRNHLWIEMSTTDEMEIKRLATLIKLKNASLLEAPVSGGEHRAKTGNIAILAAGERKFFDRAFPVLAEIGYEI